MAKKISQLTQATELKSDDVTVIVQDGETKKLPLNMMVTKQDIEDKKVTGLAKLDEIEATYENDTYTPTITVKNKSSVKVGEGDGVDYSANVMDGPAKSAILKGQTLVNLTTLDDYTFSKHNNIVIGTTISLDVKTSNEIKYTVLEEYTDWTYFTVVINLSMLKPNTTYFIIGDIISNIKYARICTGDTKISLETQLVNFNRNNYVKIITNDLSNNTDPNIRLYLRPISGLNVGDVVHIKNIRFIEYQDGMENWDIPYFEGMQSVKMPVLTTIGKNVFDEKQVPEQLSWGDNVKKANVKENTTYVYSSSPYTGYVSIKFYDNNDNEIKQEISINSGTSFTTPPNTSYLKAHTSNTSLVQIEEGSVATSYEPYKSNILTAKEDVVLRGIGNVKDTLDISTGEKVERIGEVFLNGSEGWSYNPNWSNGDYLASYTKFFTSKANGSYNILSNNIQTGRFITNGVPTSEFICGENGSHVVYVCLRKDRLLSSPSDNINDYRQAFLEYLQKNPITVQYQLATESIKTVDLIPSGTHPSTTPYCWKDGHIQLSSSGLLPSLEYSVVTSRAGQISQNAAMIVKNDKRIFDLEILLAGGLVNTTYQALTLQNQVETGLSKVSLSSETEPDYLLYHMIMKLIEEKAYKLDDLTEKVSVFYLYEKLSDEQFETIYSALYPFAEDEIIEEPVVEELPEVVEDEVIM